MRMLTLFLRINPEKIHFFKSILEGYDGLAMMSTIDVSLGLVLVRYSEPAQRDVIALLSSLAPTLKASDQVNV
jgi:hypothetical protein